MTPPTSTSAAADPQSRLRAGLERRIRAAWWKVRPFQLPKYRASTPWVGRGGPLDFHLTPTAETVGAAAMSEEAAAAGTPASPGHEASVKPAHLRLWLYRLFL